MSRVLYCAARDVDGLPKALTVGCFILGKIENRPMYVRVVNKNVVITITLADKTEDGAATKWVGWVMVRPRSQGTFGTTIPDKEAVGTLCWVKAEHPLMCAAALGEAIGRGMQESHSAGSTKAAQKMRGKKVW